MEIKTVFSINTQYFDEKVNAALADGWQLVKRISDRPEGWIAELVKPDAPVEAEPCNPWDHIKALSRICQEAPDCPRCPVNTWCHDEYNGLCASPQNWSLSKKEADA